MKSAYEFWMNSPKHSPPTDMDIATAMSEYASYYLWMSQPELKTQCDRLRQEKRNLENEIEQLKAISHVPDNKRP